MVERTLARLAKCRTMVVRYDKHAETSWACSS
jgi:hypothetical protein